MRRPQLRTVAAGVVTVVALACVTGLGAVLETRRPDPGAASARTDPRPPSPSTQAVAPPPVLSPRPVVVWRLRLLSANVPFTLRPARARAQIARVLRARPDVAVLQEVVARDVAGIVRRLGGDWRVWQPPGVQGASAVVWDPGRVQVLRTGAAFGYATAATARWMPYVVVRARPGRRVAVVGLHLPTDASIDAAERARYLTMLAAYRRLVTRLRCRGLAVVAGGDWNHPLDVARESWSPVPVNAALGMTTNWQQGLPCRGTSSRLGRIDGFAYDPAGLRLADQGCLDRGWSDHRPVWAAFEVR